MPTRTVLRLAATILSVGAFSACSDAVSSVADVAPPRSPEATVLANQEVVLTSLVSERTDLSSVGPDDRRVFGWNLLTGTSEFLGEPVEVRLQGAVQYLDGSGPFSGFIRIVAADASQVALEVNGQATTNAIGTTFDGRLEFLGASGRFSDVITAGRFTGQRAAELGSPVEVIMELLVERLNLGS